ncbi:MAG TPA: M3 family metallopeptidase [Pseudomonadales bacterium]|nr:M3 family metallopeptidase [Pseudomonadales bacterium]
MPQSQPEKNPLLDDVLLPHFSLIKAEHIEPAISAIIAESLQYVDALAAKPAPDWATLVQPLHNINDRLEKAWAPVSHMNAVVQSAEWRAAHDACLPLLSDYHTRMGQHRGLFNAYTAIKNSSNFPAFSQAQKKVIDNALRDFRLSGIDLPVEQQRRYAEICSKLSALSSDFSNHLLDATRAWTKHITDETLLAGLPESARISARAQAEATGEAGYKLTLDGPCYVAVMTYADNRELRRDMYEAYVTRASECGPQAGQFDNSGIIEEILSLRHELAHLLGFGNYAAYSLETKMAESPQHVADFLWQLADRSRPVAQQEFMELQNFASENFSIDDIQSWDVSWLSEKLRESRYAVDQEQLRQYFPAGKVLDGLFAVISRLFAVDIVEEHGADTWHADAHCYRLSRKGEVIAFFYTDLYARENKRGGAWMGDCRVRRRLDNGSIQLPVAFLTCNFMAPTASQPSLLTFDEVTTLFHEFGHGLHHMLTQVECAPVSGINGVEWDAVELPSQFLENWCWQPRVIPLISGHYQTGEPLSADMLQKMLAAKNFQSGMQMLRQLEFSLFDLLLHWRYEVNGTKKAQAVLDAVREKLALLKPPSFNRFQNGFAHVFAGGYAAGYYSYKWAEVLSADAFAVFEETDIFDDATGSLFLCEILERGGTEDAMSLFRRFRGRDPEIDALLRHTGLADRCAA